MKLAELLHRKGPDIHKIKAKECIADAAVALTENKIGALLVEDDAGKIVGILSERDIVGGMGPHGADLHDVAVAELMTPDPIHCSPEDTVIEAMAFASNSPSSFPRAASAASMVGWAWRQAGQGLNEVS